MFGSSQFTFGSSTPSNPFGTQPTAVAASTQSNNNFMFGGATANNAVRAPLNSTFSFGTASTASQPLSFGSALNTTSSIRPFGATSAFGTLNSVSSSTTAPTSTGFGTGQLFGSTPQQTPQPSTLFGGSSVTPAFGNPMPTATSNIFGSTMTTSTTTQTGTTVKFDALSGTDTMRTKNNTFATINTKLQCITSMKEYLNKSMEELRYED
ncbi:unnamed protein product, partial [Didymodactylos carnosus]